MHFRLEISGALAMTSAIAVMTIGLLASPTHAQELPAAKDTIFARKILMGAIDMNMDEIETMLAPEGKLELADAQEHAEMISTMLMAFPHMFPPATPMETGRGSRSCDRYVRVARGVDELCGFLSARDGRFKDRMECQPCQTPRRF